MAQAAKSGAEGERSSPQLTQRIGNFGLLLGLSIPVAFLFSDQMAGLIPNTNSFSATVFWPISYQYSSLVEAGAAGRPWVTDFFVADIFLVTTLLWFISELVAGSCNLQFRDRLLKRVGSSEIDYWIFGGAGIGFGIFSLVISTMKGSFHWYVKAVPGFVMSPKVFIATATFMLFTGMWFLAEGILFYVWWIIRGRRLLSNTQSSPKET